MQQNSLLPRRINTLGKATHFLISILPGLPTEMYDAEQSFEYSQQFLAAFDNPQNAHKVIHVAGTSGKGTVCYQIDAILRAHDKRSGLMVSPHVYDIRERMQFDGQLISERMFLETLNKVLPHLAQLATQGKSPHYPALLQFMGFLASTRIRLDYLVVETGMGGRLDGSNTTTRADKYCVLTQIGLDHTDQLGTTYQKIAGEKVAIVQQDNWVSALRQRESVNTTFQETFTATNADVSWVESTGDYVTDDYLLALDCVQRVAQRDGWKFDEELAKRAVAHLYIPGRFEKRTYHSSLVVMDAAHNPQKLSALAGRLKREDIAPATVVLALGDHKDAVGSLRSLLPVAKRLILCEFFLDNPEIPRRPIPAQDLQVIAKEIGFTDIEVIRSPHSALQKASNYPEPVVVTGSFYLLGEIDKAF